MISTVDLLIFTVVLWILTVISEKLTGHFIGSVLLCGACYYGHKELVKNFLQNANVSINSPVQKVPLHEIHNADKLTPMYAACKGKDSVAVSIHLWHAIGVFRSKL